MALLLTIVEDLIPSLLSYLHDAYFKETLDALLELGLITPDQYEKQFYNRCNSLIGGHYPEKLQVGRNWLFFLLSSVMERLYKVDENNKEHLNHIESIYAELDTKYEALSKTIPYIGPKFTGYNSNQRSCTRCRSMGDNPGQHLYDECGFIRGNSSQHLCDEYGFVKDNPVQHSCARCRFMGGNLSDEAKEITISSGKCWRRTYDRFPNCESMKRLTVFVLHFCSQEKDISVVTQVLLYFATKFPNYVRGEPPTTMINSSSVLGVPSVVFPKGCENTLLRNIASFVLTPEQTSLVLDPEIIASLFSP